MILHTRKYGSQRASASQDVHIDEAEYSPCIVLRTFKGYEDVTRDDKFMVITPTTEEEWKKLMSVVHRGYRLFVDQKEFKR